MRRFKKYSFIGLVGSIVFVFSCVKKSDINILNALNQTEVKSTALSTPGPEFFTAQGGKWNIVWIQQITINSNEMYDTVTVSIPYTYPAIGSFTVNCQGNVYDTSIFIYNTVEYEKLRFFSSGTFEFSLLTKQQQPVSYNLNCSLNPLTYTLSSPFSAEGTWTFQEQGMKLNLSYIDYYTADNYPVTRHLVGESHLVDNQSFYFEGVDSSYHQSPTTGINAPSYFKYLIVKAN